MASPDTRVTEPVKDVEQNTAEEKADDRVSQDVGAEAKQESTEEKAEVLEFIEDVGFALTKQSIYMVGSFPVVEEEKEILCPKKLSEQAPPSLQIPTLIQDVPLRELHSFFFADRKIVCCEFSPNAQLIVAGTQSGKVLTWNLSDFALRTSSDHSQFITDVQFTNDSRHYATSSIDGKLRLWKAEAPALPFKSCSSKKINSFDIHPIKYDVLCSCDDKSVLAWNTSRTKPPSPVQLVMKDRCKKLRFQPGNGEILALLAENNVYLFGIDNARKVTSLITSRQYMIKGNEKNLNDFAWNRNGSLISTVSDDEARIWSVDLNESVCMRQLHLRGLQVGPCVFYNRNGVDLLLIVVGQNLCVWNYMEDTVNFWAAHKSPIQVITASGDRLAIVGEDGGMKIWGCL